MLMIFTTLETIFFHFTRTFWSVCALICARFLVASDYSRNSGTKTTLIAEYFCGSCFAFFDIPVS